MRPARRLPLALALLVLSWPPSAGAVEGKYSRRQKQRGEVTDTAPKLDRWAFINDEAPKPLELVLVVDTWMARHPKDPRLLPLLVAMSFEGDGKPIPIRPELFQLAWEGGEAPVRALRQAELKDAASGPSPVYQDLRMLGTRSALAFDTPNARRIGVQFYTHSAMRSMVHDELTLPAQSWFSTLMYFPVPEGFGAWDGLFELRYVPVAGEPPAVAAKFRIQRDPGVQQDAMRKARKDLKKEDAREGAAP